MNRIAQSVALGLIAAIVGAGPAFADKWLGSATIFGGNAQNRVVCTLNNVGTAPVSLSNLRIFNNAGAAQALDLNNCGAVLGPKQTCSFAINTVSQRIYGCKVFVNRRAIMRGVIQVFDVSGDILQVQPMQ